MLVCVGGDLPFGVSDGGCVVARFASEAHALIFILAIRKRGAA